MAEIELGTLNNPEITLFLNAQDELEFQDSDGNVIATFKQDQSSEFDSVSTDALSGALANNTTIERVLGGGSGEVIPVSTFGVDSDVSDTTTSTTYVDSLNLLDARWIHDTFDVENATVVYKLLAFIQPDSGTGFARVWNSDDSETVVEISTSSNGVIDSSWTAYTATPTGGQHQYRAQIKNDAGASTTVEDLTLFVGLQL